MGTYKLPLAESKAIAYGPPGGTLPTIIGLPMTVLFLPDTTETEKSCVLVTYKLPLAGSKAIPHGLPSAAQHGIFLITVLF
jgi:hypothetical protein